MAYNLAPNDDRPSSYPSPNSSDRRSYFNEQALRSAYSARIDPRETEFQRYDTQLREPVEWDPVRERIRAEILDKEMERRRILEQEIRLELMVDREFAMQRWEASRMRGGEVASPSIVHAPRVYSEHQVAAPGRDIARFDMPGGVTRSVQESSPNQLGHYQGRMYPVMPVAMPYQHHLMPVSGLGSRDIHYPPKNMRNMSTLDIIHPPENRRDYSTPAKREANHSGLIMKRKASALGVDRPWGTNLEKKPRLWTCELCKVSTTNERGLNDHLVGKRHKETVEGLSSGQKTGAGSSTTSDPVLKKPIKAHVKPSERNSAAEATIVDKKPISEKNSLVPIQKPGPPPTTPAKVESAKKPLPTKPVKGETPRVFKYWCNICKVKTTSEINMAIHEKGKKHLANTKLLSKH